MNDCVRDPSTPGASDASFRVKRAGTAAAAGLAALMAAGCASSYAAFRSEREIPDCARLLREADTVPASVLRVPAGTAGGRPFSVAIEERGSGSAERVLVLVHGVLSDRRTWRFMTGRLAAEHDVLLVDLPGCGGSDRPDPSAFGPRGYDPDALAAAVMTAVARRLEARERSPAVTLVGHSLGAGIILRALGNPALRERFAGALDRVDGAVLFSSPDWSYAKRDPVFEAISDLGGLEIAVGNALGLVHERVADSVRNGVESPGATPREEVDRIWEILSDPELRAAAQSMILSAIPFREDRSPDWDLIEVMEEDLGRVDVPCLLVCGGRDDALPEALSFKLSRQIPDARLRVFSRSGHSLPTERPEECAGLVLEFARTLGKGWITFKEAPRRFDAEAPADLAAGSK